MTKRDDNFDYYSQLDAEKVVSQAEKRKKKKIKTVLIISIAAVVLIAAAVIYITGFVKLTGFDVISTIEMSNTDKNIKIYDYHDGYIKCTGEGLTYFDKDEFIWMETFNMSQPMVDICEDYIVAADMKATEAILYGPSGYLNTISLTRVATAVQVSKFGTVAVVTSEGNSNYIQVFDKEGNELVTIKTVFDSSGYVSDIALSDDGAMLAAAFIGVKNSKVLSRVNFYDLTKDTSLGEEVIVGTFEQYEGTVLTDIKFMADGKVVAVGDNAFTIYSAGSSPKIVYEELNLTWQTQSIFFSEKYLGLIVSEENTENIYSVKAYDMTGALKLEKGFDYSYNHADFAGNAVVIYSDNDCDIYNFFGTHKFSYTFDDKIVALKSTGDEYNFIYMKGNATEFIRLK